MITPSYGLTATERVLPRLALDWTTGLAQPEVDVVRAGVATFVGSNGLIQFATADTQRIDWSTGTAGLLVEESRTNNFTNSENFNGWSKPLIIVTTDVAAPLAPDGTQTADKIIPNTTFNDHVITQGKTLTAITYTNSVFIYPGEYEWFVLWGVGFANAKAFFNAATGAIGSVTGTGSPVARISPAGNGWYRCELSFTASATFVNYGYASASANGITFFPGNNVNGIYAWGAQLEAGAFATSYIPTTTTALTRNADVATITGTNFSDFWQASKGGASVQAIPSTVSGIRPLVQYDDGTANNIIALRGNAANPELQIVDGGAPQVQLDAGTIVANTPYSLTGWWSTNDCKARQNSGATVSDYTATIPTVTQARLGSDGTNYLNGHLATINYYDRFSGQIYDRRKNKAVFSLL